MAKLHHSTLKKLVAEYSELILSDLATAEAKLAEAGHDEDAIAQVVEAVTNAPQGGDAPDKPADKPKAKKESKGTPEVLHFEKTELKADGKGGFKKGDVLRIVKITQAQADILNEQSANTRIGYYLTEK